MLAQVLQVIYSSIDEHCSDQGWKQGFIYTAKKAQHQDELQIILHLLNDNPKAFISERMHKTWLAGLTAAKKIIAQQKNPPHDLPPKQWLWCLLDILYLELPSSTKDYTNMDRFDQSCERTFTSMIGTLGFLICTFTLWTVYYSDSLPEQGGG